VLILVTGFPGFIGKRLVAKLLANDPDARITAVVEPRMAARAETVAAEIGDGRVEVLPGDIADRRLALASDDYERLIAETELVYHLAAIYDLAVPIELAQKVNVEGTGNVLALCDRCERLERLHYVSTAYVAGERTGIVYEHELALGQAFKNHYESTKFQAEVWVREALDRVPATIYRPAIVVGDSRTGETQKFDGPYYMLRSIAVAEQRRMPIAQYGRSEATFNVVPVDFIVDALAAAPGDPETAGETLHLVDPQPVAASEVLALLAHEYAGRGPSYRLPPRLVMRLLRSKRVRDAFAGVPSEAIRYLNHPVRFDTRRADALLERHGLRAPSFEDYVEPIVRFFCDNEDDPAFRPGAG
jgi:thioester reductase-like protein